MAEVPLTLEAADLILLLRVLGMVVFLACAALSMRLLSLYKGSLLEEPWLPVSIGVVFLAVNNLLVAMIAVAGYPFRTDLFLILRSILTLIGSIFLLFGLYRALKIWKALHKMTSLILTARDTEESQVR